MPLPRSSLVSLDITPFYHCISRCVRRTHLCGIDDATGKSYEKRRDWLESRLLFLTDVFAIRLCSYSIMHNHYHTVLHLTPAQSVSWSDQDIITRWHKIYRGSTLSRSFIKNEPLGCIELEELHRQCVKWKERLCSISWFMKSANEPLARMANKEDDCTGHFWEGRFKSKAILDYKALMASMVYTDLNPIKAGIAKTIQSSNHTSIRRRTQYAGNQTIRLGLMPFAEEEEEESVIKEKLPFTLPAYIEAIQYVIDTQYKPSDGKTELSCPALLKQLSMTQEQWSEVSTQFESLFRTVVGTENNMRDVSKILNRQWLQGISNCQRCFSSEHYDINPLNSKRLANKPTTQITTGIDPVP